MKIWKLSVFNEVSFDWRASTYKGETIIRAESEHNARRLATGVRLILRFKLGKMMVDEERPKMLPAIA